MLLPFGQISPDGRLLANLITVHLLLLLLLGLSFALRWLVTHSGNRIARWAGTEHLKQFSDEATRHGHTMLFWLTVTVMALTVVGGILFHVAGRDARVELTNWYNQLTPEELLRVAVGVGGVVVLAILTTGLVRVMRRVLPLLETYAMGKLGHPKNEESLRSWFHLLEGFAILWVRLAAILIGCLLLGIGHWATAPLGDVLLGIAIVALARLVTLAGRSTTHAFAAYGNGYFGATIYNRYWERILLLFPFGQRCFEAAVYVTAAWLVVDLCHIIYSIQNLGPRIVECIGIFFGTRVAIELSQVLLNEAFGMYKEENQVDQKGRTLVPLLQSVCQYALYFGSFIMILRACRWIPRLFSPVPAFWVWASASEPRVLSPTLCLDSLSCLKRSTWWAITSRSATLRELWRK